MFDKFNSKNIKYGTDCWSVLKCCCWNNYMYYVKKIENRNHINLIGWTIS